jgi:hypothetical protein
MDADGHGTLVVNANRVMHLNPTAALMAYLILECKSEKEIVQEISKKYKVKGGQIASDLSTFNLQLSEL